MSPQDLSEAANRIQTALYLIGPTNCLGARKHLRAALAMIKHATKSKMTTATPERCNVTTETELLLTNQDTP